MYLCARNSISEDAYSVFLSDPLFVVLFFFFHLVLSDLAELPTGGTMILFLNPWTNHHPPTTT